MKRIATSLIAGAVLAVPAGADAAIVSTARAEVEAGRAVAPLQVESVACFRSAFNPRKPRVEHLSCVVFTPAPAGQTCAVTVDVKARKRPRRISSRVIVPLRCWATALPIGSIEGR
jgi:hypothetical protein